MVRLLVHTSSRDRYGRVSVPRERVQKLNSISPAIAILVLTVRRSFVTRSHRNAAPILATFFRDGITYFVIAFATALVNSLFFAFAPLAMRPWMTNYLRPLLSSMATRLLLNLHEQVSQTAHYTNPPTTMNSGGIDRLSTTVEFAPFSQARDVESVLVDGRGGGLEDEDWIEGSTLELKPLEKNDREELNDGLEWAFNVRSAVPGNEQQGLAKRFAKVTADPG
ncbi:hypothetical protein FRB90_003311 [Tulasnella sp. 427]|nr:hypothetical protein FRB90_003311 [Tulasnella sp. 427]